jgi:hypothetical protein
MSFVNAVKTIKNNAPARTANGMKARDTTASPVLDLFGLIGSARGSDITAQFTKALVEDANLTVRMLLWARDIREGSGERQTFRNLLAHLESHDPTLAGKLMHKVPELGRFDDLFSYSDPQNRKQALRFYAQTLVNGPKAKLMLNNIDEMTEDECQSILDSF